MKFSFYKQNTEIMVDLISLIGVVFYSLVYQVFYKNITINYYLLIKSLVIYLLPIIIVSDTLQTYVKEKEINNYAWNHKRLLPFMFLLLALSMVFNVSVEGYYWNFILTKIGYLLYLSARIILVSNRKKFFSDYLRAFEPIFLVNLILIIISDPLINQKIEDDSMELKNADYFYLNINHSFGISVSLLYEYSDFVFKKNYSISDKRNGFDILDYLNVFNYFNNDDFHYDIHGDYFEHYVPSLVYDYFHSDNRNINVCPNLHLISLYNLNIKQQLLENNQIFNNQTRINGKESNKTAYNNNYNGDNSLDNSISNSTYNSKYNKNTNSITNLDIVDKANIINFSELFFRYYEFHFIVYACLVLNGDSSLEFEIDNNYLTLVSILGKYDSFLFFLYSSLAYYLFVFISIFIYGLVYLIQFFSILMTIYLVNLYKHRRIKLIWSWLFSYIALCLLLNLASAFVAKLVY